MMIINFSPEERKKIQEIQDNYQPERERLAKLLEKTTDREERTKILHQQQAIIDTLQAELSAYFEKIQRKRFKPIKEAGADAIIAHAKGQAPALLEEVHRITINDYKDINAEALKRMGIGTIRDGLLYLNANYAAQALKDELKLHIEALLENKTALQELYALIIEAAENSDYTDNEEVKDLTQDPLKVMRFRRRPLDDISYYGLMNDKINAQLLQDGDIFQQETDGQIKLLWAVNQTPQKREAITTYIALTYEGTETKLNKKMSAFDKQVYEAVSTRYYYWRQENPQAALLITPQEIWRTMNGKRSGDSKTSNPSKGQIQRICASLDKMRFTRCYMDVSEEAILNNCPFEDERFINGTVDTYLLNSTKAEFVTDKGNTVQGYRISEEPILYYYNKKKNHVLYVPYEMLDTSQYTSDSENVAEFKGYLLQQIQLMKNAAENKKDRYFKRNNIILIDTIYNHTGIKIPEERIEGRDFTNEASKQTVIRRLRKADREKIEGLLTAWTAKGYIKGYTVLNQNDEPIKEKQQAKGYRIDI